MTVYIVELESVETRYTAQWASEIPKQLGERNIPWQKVTGPDDVPDAVTEGAFLNFGGTNVWKARQMENIARMFTDGIIKDGDYFLYTDAWNPTVIQLKYMSELLGVKVRIGGLWHAGSYDPQDFLGRLIGDAPWVRSAERSMFSCYDDNFFATNFHIDMFAEGVLDYNPVDWSCAPKDMSDTIQQIGWPMDYMREDLAPYANLEKENIVLFPHRIAPEKQVDIFKELAKDFPDYEFIVCQEQTLTKHEYHTLLGKAKMVFSANLQETLGIGCYEGALVGAFPMVPDRLSYKEMYDIYFTYPSHWTESFDASVDYKKSLVNYMRAVLDGHEEYQRSAIVKLTKQLDHNFFSGEKLYKILKDHNNENNISNGR